MFPLNVEYCPNSQKHENHLNPKPAVGVKSKSKTLCNLIISNQLKICINSLISDSCITLDVDGDSSVDVFDGDIIRIKKAEKFAKVIKVNDVSFYEILRQKLSKANYN